MVDFLSNVVAAFHGVRKRMFDCFSPAFARGSSLIGSCVNEMTVVPEWVPSSCKESEAARVRTGQGSSPIG
ncbi:hypothetical protein TNCV_2883201 [Trichonephila clavipes]|nr:hypothetical protein TNCV_2883201 [Trichonephila clavipes]